MGGAGLSPAFSAPTFALVGHELEGAAVHAVAQSRGVRSVVEHMAEMGLAGGAAHFRSAHEQRAVLMLGHRALVGGGVEARPARTRSEFGVGSEQRVAAAYAHVHAFALLIEIGPGPRPLGAVLAGHMILLGSELFAPFGVGFLDLGTRFEHGSPPG